MFDWSEMARQALGRHWEQRTPEERAEFTRLFSDLFEESYVSTVKLSEALTFTYLGDSIAGERAVVRTTVTTRHGNEIAVAYRTRLRGDAQWKVYDLDVESVSLVRNYRFQIDKILLHSSYRELLEKLKEKSKRDGAGRSGMALPSWEISTPGGYEGGGRPSTSLSIAWGAAVDGDASPMFRNDSGRRQRDLHARDMSRRNAYA